MLLMAIASIGKASSDVTVIEAILRIGNRADFGLIVV
jgi:hypothetical protein